MEKEEAQKYNNELFRYLGVRYKCNTIRDYYLIKTLYTLFQIFSSEEVLKYYDELLDEYFDMTGVNNKDIKQKVYNHTIEDFYYNYGFTEGLYQYWLKYYYPTCLNFVSFLAIYSGEEVPYTVFENTTKTAMNKTFKFMENQSIEMIRNEMSLISIFTKMYEKIIGYKLLFVWRAKKDEKTCSICKSLDGKIYRYVPDKAHPNCRCTLELDRRLKD